MFPRRRVWWGRKSGPPSGEYPLAREGLYLLDEFDQIREYFGDV